jgi:16S rRNA (guanine527-N7)-methyltransferase
MTEAKLDAEAFQAATGVSRETLDRLRVYEGLLRKWQPAINLVGPKTLDDAWRRHFLDSAQLLPLIPESTRTLVDLGSGAGFPGMVLAILGNFDVHLIESDIRKATFLREVARATGTAVQIHAKRLETLGDLAADVVTARALAPLASLLDWVHPFIGERGLALFPKGRNADQELTEADRIWMMAVDRTSSRTETGGTLLRIRQLRRR